MNTRPTNTSSSPVNAVDQAFREVTASLARCRDASAQTTLSLLRVAASAVLEAREQAPAERNIQLIQVSYDHLVELRERMTSERRLTESDLLAEPLTCVAELIDMARDLLDGPPANPEKSQS